MKTRQVLFFNFGEKAFKSQFLLPKYRIISPSGELKKFIRAIHMPTQRRVVSGDALAAKNYLSHILLLYIYISNQGTFHL